MQQKSSNLNSFLIEDCEHGIEELELETNKKFGVTPVYSKRGSKQEIEELEAAKSVLYPLLLSVRSAVPGAATGELRSILNLGMNEDVVAIMIARSQNPYWVYDTYRRFLQGFGSVVLGLGPEPYQKILQDSREKAGVEHNFDLSLIDLQAVVDQFRKITDVPEDPWEQLFMAIKANYMCWGSAPAVKQREDSNNNSRGTAVIVQSMVYGNMNTNSGCGVMFSRNPTTGEPELSGEFLVCAQGDQYEAGSAPPKSFEEFQNRHPLVYDNLFRIAQILENKHRDMQVSSLYCHIHIQLNGFLCRRSSSPTRAVACTFSSPSMVVAPWPRLCVFL